jgi:hypothetical protein
VRIKDRVLSWIAPGSWREVLVSVLPFVLLGALYIVPRDLARALRELWEPAPALVGFGPSLLLLVLGVVAGLPRWALPNWGFVLFIPSVLLSIGLLDILRPPAIRVVWAIPDGGVSLILALAALHAIAFATAVRPLRPLYARIRKDWSQVSFGLYGAAPMMVGFSFDMYRGAGLYVILGFLALAMGAWAYLRAGRPWQRLLALAGGVAVAASVVTLGKWMLCPCPHWPEGVVDCGTDVSGTILQWGQWAAVILAPALLVLLPRAAGEDEPPAARAG